MTACERLKATKAADGTRRSLPAWVEEYRAMRSACEPVGPRGRRRCAAPPDHDHGVGGGGGGAPPGRRRTWALPDRPSGSV